MYLSVVIPAYNEEKNIADTSPSVYSYLKSKNIEHEILVVADGSKDRTPQIVKDLFTEMPTLNLLFTEINLGKGFCVKSGMLRAKGEYRLFMDADNSTRINHIESMLPYFKQGYDVVIGSIYIPGAKIIRGESRYRTLFGAVSRMYTRIFLLPGIQDTQRGFKIFTGKVTEDIFNRLTIEKFGFDMEVLAIARKLGYKIKEAPIEWDNDPDTHVKPSAYVQVLFDTLKIKWNLIRGKYNPVRS